MTDAWFEPDPHGPLAASRIVKRGRRVEWIRVRQGGYFSLLPQVQDGAGLSIESNDERTVPGTTGMFGPMRFEREMLAQLKLVAFARTPGEAALIIASPAANNAEARIRVSVQERIGSQKTGPALAKLSGRICAINAPDVKGYAGAPTLTCPAGATSQTFLNTAPVAIDHLLLAGHMVSTVPNRSPQSPDEMALGLGGKAGGAFCIEPSNVVSAFERIRDRMATDGVVWIGGCSLAQARKLCFAAAVAANRVVVAASAELPDVAIAKGHVDLLDNRFASVAFMPDGITAISAVDFAALQTKYRFFLSPN